MHAVALQFLFSGLSYLFNILCQVYLKFSVHQKEGFCKSLMSLTHLTGDTALVLLPDTIRGGEGEGGRSMATMARSE